MVIEFNWELSLVNTIVIYDSGTIESGDVCTLHTNSIELIEYGN